MSSNLRTDPRNILGFLRYARAMCLTCVLAACNAQAGGQPRAETVKFADLNLNTPAGVEVLYERIHKAALRVCDKRGQLAATIACTKRAESRAIAKVNAPSLTAFYQKKTGQKPQTVTASL